MGIHQGRLKLTGSNGAGQQAWPEMNPAASTAWVPTLPSTEAQVEEILHQFKSASSQGEGNG